MLLRIGVFVAAFALLAVPAIGAELDDAIATIKAVKREGDGNEKAARAWKIIVKEGALAVPGILAAYDGADETAANWLRSAIDAIAETEQTAGRKLSADMLEAFIKETKHDPRARHLAFDLLSQSDPAARKRLLPGLIDDPGAGLRREAIDFAIETANPPGGNDEAQRLHLRTLFTAARDVDQVEAIAKKLKDLGEGDTDVVGHLGLITRWQVAGPFDNPKLKGFAAPLPKVEKWTNYATGQPRALVDLYEAFGKAKGVKDGKKDAIYALCRTEIDSPTERPAEIRMATDNAVKIFLNGQEVFSREEYHHNRRLDQHIARVTLKKGRNEILIKVCQDDAIMEWTFEWAFQCRVCDSIGGAVPFTVLTAPNAIPVKPTTSKEKP